jgi:Endonuclease NucS
MLTQGGTGWQFVSEEVLEDFLWSNLSLLGLEGLSRQYGINGDICDIVARDTQGQLVILELKNCEDRGIVQQLTRYYDTLTETRVFTTQTEHRLGIRLIAMDEAMKPYQDRQQIEAVLQKYWQEQNATFG